MSSNRNKKRRKSGKSLNERISRRRKPDQDPLPVKVIVCDDSKTAPNYFDALIKEVQDYVTLRVEPAKGDTSANTIAEEAIEQLRKLNKESRSKKDKDKVWALIDYEHESHLRESAKRAKSLITQKSGKQQRLEAILSDPCFEVWTLLHLEDTGQHFADCKAVLTRLKQKWRSRFSQPFPAKKAQADYSKIIPKRREAANRAKRHWENEDQSRTEVYKIIEDIESHVSQRAKGTPLRGY